MALAQPAGDVRALVGDHHEAVAGLQPHAIWSASRPLLVAGPNPAIDNEDPGPNGFSGSVIIAEFPTLQAAQQWADQDPYIEAGVYKNVTVKPFKKVLP